MHLQVYIKSLLGEIHCLQQLFILAGGLDVLLLHHSVHFFPVLISDGLKPVQGVKLQVLVQQLQDVGHTCEGERHSRQGRAPVPLKLGPRRSPSNTPIAKPSSVKAAPVLFFLLSFSLRLMECSTKFTVYRREQFIQTACARKQSRCLQKQRKGPGTDQWGHNHVEVPQVHVFGTAEFGGKYRHQHLEVLGPLCRVAGQIPQN